MKAQLWSIAVLAIMLTCGVGTSWGGNVLYNGDFEADPWNDNWYAWGGNPFYEHGGLGPAGGDAAMGVPIANGNIAQSIDLSPDLPNTHWANPLPQWTLEFLAAGGDPGTKRTLSMGVRHGVYWDNVAKRPWFTGQINFRIVRGTEAGKGNIEVYGDPGGVWGWYLLLGNAFDFSVDADGDKHFDGENDVLNVNTIKMVGDYSTASPSYDVHVTDSAGMVHSIPGVAIWSGAPMQGDGVGSICYTASSSAIGAPFVVDNVTLVPEPSIAALILIGLGVLLVRRLS